MPWTDHTISGWCASSSRATALTRFLGAGLGQRTGKKRLEPGQTYSAKRKGPNLVSAAPNRGLLFRDGFSPTEAVDHYDSALTIVNMSRPQIAYFGGGCQLGAASSLFRSFMRAVTVGNGDPWPDSSSLMACCVSWLGVGCLAFSSHHRQVCDGKPLGSGTIKAFP